MSRSKATKQWQGKTLVEELAAQGIIIRCPSMRGVAEEAPLACKDVSAVVDIADRAGLARKVARLEPVICIKGLPAQFRLVLNIFTEQPSVKRWRVTIMI
jgi:tRNA-splicing ligase RtcB